MDPPPLLGTPLTYFLPMHPLRGAWVFRWTFSPSPPSSSSSHLQLFFLSVRYRKHCGGRVGPWLCMPSCYSSPSHLQMQRCKDDLSVWRRRNTSYSYYYSSSSSSFSFSTPLTFQITWNMGPVSQMWSCYKTMSDTCIKLTIRYHETGLLTDFATHDVVK